MSIRQAQDKQTIIRRLTVWAVIVVGILLIPLFLTIRDGGVEGVGWNWTFFDFVFMFTLLFGAGVVYELVARKMNHTAYRLGVGLAVLTAVLLLWVNAAVGLIGDGDVPNALYFLVLAIGLIGALMVRFDPRGMSRVLFVVTFAQLLVPVVALIIWPPSVTSWSPGVAKVFILNGFFAALFAGSALLFWRAGEAASH